MPIVSQVIVTISMVAPPANLLATTVVVSVPIATILLS